MLDIQFLHKRLLHLVACKNTDLTSIQFPVNGLKKKNLAVKLFSGATNCLRPGNFFHISPFTYYLVILQAQTNMFALLQPKKAQQNT